MCPNPSLNPSEKIILLSLRVQPNQTIEQIQASVGTKTLKYLRKTLRTLVLAGVITYDADSGTYNALAAREAHA